MPDPSSEIEDIIQRKMQELKDEQKKSVDEDTGKPSALYFEFPGTFTTNLMDSRKFLQVGLGISAQSDDLINNVEAHQMALRTEVLGVISDFSEGDIEGASGRAKLADAIRNKINEKLISLENIGGVDKVHFTSFVLQ